MSARSECGEPLTSSTRTTAVANSRHGCGDDKNDVDRALQALTVSAEVSVCATT